MPQGARQPELQGCCGRGAVRCMVNKHLRAFLWRFIMRARLRTCAKGAHGCRAVPGQARGRGRGQGGRRVSEGGRCGRTGPGIRRSPPPPCAPEGTRAQSSKSCADESAHRRAGIRGWAAARAHAARRAVAWVVGRRGVGDDAKDCSDKLRRRARGFRRGVCGARRCSAPRLAPRAWTDPAHRQARHRTDPARRRCSSQSRRVPG